MMKTRILITLFPFLFFSLGEIYCQNFKVSPLIDMPGDNLEFDVLCSESGMPNGETYICWINKLDALYTVYLKEISPILGDDIVVSSGSQIKSRPQIAINRYSQGIKIVWEAYENNAWRVYLKNYYASQLSDTMLILDSLYVDPQISLSTHRLAWTNNGNLYFKSFYPSLSDNILIDSLNCSSPEILKNDDLQDTQILYEKYYTDSIKVNLAHYNQYWNPQYEFRTLSNGLSSINPRFGMHGEIAFQTYQDNVWKSAYAFSSYHDLILTNNEDCSFRHPILFTYPVPISLSKGSTPFFLAFDTDSISGNNEIFIKTFYFSLDNGLLNVSQSEGNDYEPRVAYLSNADSVFISIIWKHNDNGKTDIWMAKDIYDPIINSVRSGYAINHSIDLMQNYPNPFNPSTTITFTLTSKSMATLKIFDILGREVSTLISGVVEAGRHSIVWNATGIPSGAYFYRFRIGSYEQTRKLIILK